MNIRSTLAAEAYINTRPATQPQPLPEAQPVDTGFSKLAEDFVTTLQEGEATAKAAMTGDADPHALVQALAQTELAVETAVTLRDKVVEAYQEILRMPV
ncbi:Flagellar hook-basal body complex protein FliE [Candidatus Rhodobacter oscarellae]|uniref:Flagellar hook-basal body complex protein FliE n=1 Tax=Candidatus Rhodobacter oscarellae TaxID=1675527 RepID=A0A0J9E8V2_9RHOB|nr:flagellar hook-basal body complex protein FliE [Candidatus Rhodobacter lobularis]KMW59212.1 Flagellar hook-basal body complex protein FliE [Candidatus Rhodobacter lobularis]